MIQIDLHVHSIFSRCGLHTVLELINKARALGMKGLAVTDHGLTMGGRLNDVFFNRFICPFDDILFFKGIECNILDEHGAIDLPSEYQPYLDVVLLGVHPNTPKGLSREYYTSLLISAIEKNPRIDIITHPNDSVYPLDYAVIANKAASLGIALELNNSRILYSRSSVENTLSFLKVCKQERCRIAVCSDTHAIHELGQDSSVIPLLEKADFPENLIITRDASTTLVFLNEIKRKHNICY
ncbi:MAG TPA: PHP domain-containing protein [Chitinispirillaceae bacterium]|nr:PHP domain-containing protein [Chitinispirillaceae bacterium]